MVRFLVWIEGDRDGWACSNCRWRFPVPTLFSGEEEAKVAYDRLAAVRFREHTCEAATSPSPKAETKLDSGTTFADRARMLIKRGYTPKVAVDLVLHETETEHGKNSRMMEKARADAEHFLLQIRRGLI
jgi:hypothetical protein